MSRRHLSTWRNWLAWAWSKPSASQEATQCKTWYPKKCSAATCDEYRWLMNPAQLQQHLKAEATYCSSTLQRLGVTKLAEQLHLEMHRRQAASEQLPHNDQLPGEIIGNWLYSSSVAAGVLLARRAAHADQSCISTSKSQEQVVLDHDRLQAAVAAACRITSLQMLPAVVSLKLSDCHTRVAVTVPIVRPGHASEICAALLLDCNTGELLPAGVLTDVAEIEWCASSQALLATKPAVDGRPDQVWLYELPTASISTETADIDPHQHMQGWATENICHKLLQCDDPRVFVNVGRTKDGRFLLVSENTKTSCQVHLMDTYWRGPGTPTLRLVQPRVPKLDYFVEHHHGHLLLLTNHRSNTHHDQCGHCTVAPPDQHVQSGPSAQDIPPMQIKQHAQRNEDVQHMQHAQHKESAQHTLHAHAAPCCKPMQLPATGEGIQGLQLMTVPADSADLSSARWAPLQLQLALPHGASITDLDVFNGWCALYGRSPAGMPAVWVVQLGSSGVASIPQAGREASLGSTPGTCASSNSLSGPPAGSAWQQNPGLVKQQEPYGLMAQLRTPGLTQEHRTPGAEGQQGTFASTVQQAACDLVAQQSTQGLTTEQGVQQGVSGLASQEGEPGLIVDSCVQVPLPTWATHVTPGLNADPAACSLRLICSSPVHPPHTYDYHVRTAELQLLHVQQVPGSFQGVSAWADSRCGSTGAVGNSKTDTCEKSEQRMPENAQSSTSSMLASDSSSAQHHSDQDPHRHHTSHALHDPSDYTIKRLWVPFSFPTHPPAGTGATQLQIEHLHGTYANQSMGHSPLTGNSGFPVTVVYRTSLAAESSSSSSLRNQPLLLMGYGAYGQALDPAWQPTLLPLLERGIIVAYAHVRGGGEMGRPWHAAGRGTNKQQSVNDFCMALQALVHAGFSQAGLLAVHAYSAGGLLVGGALSDPNTRCLLASAVLRLAFLDLWSVMTQPNLPLTLHEVDEWGDPTNSQEAAVMQQVCPYHQLGITLQHLKSHTQPANSSSSTASQLPNSSFQAAEQQASAARAVCPLPPVLATTAEYDTRVPVWVPAKWVARATNLQALLGGTSPILLHVLWNRGHHADEQQSMQDAAVEAAFMLVAWQAQMSQVAKQRV